MPAGPHRANPVAPGRIGHRPDPVIDQDLRAAEPRARLRLADLPGDGAFGLGRELCGDGGQADREEQQTGASHGSPPKR